MVPDTRDLRDYKDMKWITDFGGDDGERLVDSVANMALRKTDLRSFAFFPVFHFHSMETTEKEVRIFNFLI